MRGESVNRVMGAFLEMLLENMSVVFCFIFLVTLTGSSNAINLSGLDGLAIGCTVTVALTYAIMAYASGNFLISDYKSKLDTGLWRIGSCMLCNGGV